MNCNCNDNVILDFHLRCDQRFALSLSLSLKVSDIFENIQGFRRKYRRKSRMQQRLGSFEFVFRSSRCSRMHRDVFDAAQTKYQYSDLMGETLVTVGVYV